MFPLLSWGGGRPFRSRRQTPIPVPAPSPGARAKMAKLDRQAFDLDPWSEVDDAKRERLLKKRSKVLPIQSESRRAVPRFAPSTRDPP